MGGMFPIPPAHFEVCDRPVSRPRGILSPQPQQSVGRAFYLDRAGDAYFEAGRPQPATTGRCTRPCTSSRARDPASGATAGWRKGWPAISPPASERMAACTLGMIDPTAYPAWWLTDSATTTIGMPIPLEVLLSGQGGPEVDTHVNQYYLSAWSLTHFLLHVDDGRYAIAYRSVPPRGCRRRGFRPPHVGSVETDPIRMGAVLPVAGRRSTRPGAFKARRSDSRHPAVLTINFPARSAELIHRSSNPCAGISPGQAVPACGSRQFQAPKEKPRIDSKRGFWGRTLAIPEEGTEVTCCGSRLRHKKTPAEVICGCRGITLAMTYSCMADAHYHRRGCVSLPSSRWDRVVPQRYCHQGEGGGSRLIRDCSRTRSRWFARQDSR